MIRNRNRKGCPTVLRGILPAFLALALCACQSNPTVTSSESLPTTESETSSSQAAEATITLFADFSAGESDGESLGLVKTKDVPLSGEATAEDLAQALSEWSGLDFTLNGSTISGDSITVDWSAEATLIAGLDDREQKEEFHFFDAVSLNWFMMDSLARTIQENLPVSTVYYSMDGGKPLSVFSMADMKTQGFFELPENVPYEGSPFFLAHSDVIGDFWYFDEETQLTLSYPNDFAADGERDADGFVRFPAREEGDAVLLYWTVPSDGEDDSQALLDRMPMEDGQILEDGAVVCYGDDMDQETGEHTPFANYCRIAQDHVANVSILCSSMEEAETWYQALVGGAVSVRGADENTPE